MIHNYYMPKKRFQVIFIKRTQKHQHTIETIEIIQAEPNPFFKPRIKIM